jgi:hypothetical protein
MKNVFSLILILIVSVPEISLSQVYVEPFAGYQKDMNNQNGNFLNTGLQVALKLRRYELVLQVQKNWPNALQGVDSSFTLNAALPLYAPAEKEISISSFSVAIGNRFKVFGKNSGSCLFFKFYTGVMLQKALVVYAYDKNNYTILNPDQTEDAAGLFVSGGLEYMWQLKKSRLFLT